MKLQINYKSGRSVQVEVDGFKVEEFPSGAKKFTWVTDMHPRPLCFGANEIESVWEIK